MTDEQQVDKPDVSGAGAADGGDLGIQGDNGNGEMAIAPLPIGRPPMAKIFFGFLALVATAMLWITAGSVRKQACIEGLTVKYPTVGLSAKSASLNTNTLKKHLDECTGSPF